MNHWEMDCGRERHLTALRYAFSRGTLTLFYPIGPSSDFALESEEDGSVHFVGVDGKSWWMTRLAAPLSFSKAHVDADGRLVILHEDVPQPGPQKPTT
ncbi:hypothetical protein [Prosthecobacter sp.]|uniref:hypothetical protein n=1 Tax=Prosthecobacter sp. TaxID=1965333 RepID=UPI00378348C7